VSTAVKGWQFDGGRWSETESLPLTDRALRYGMSVFETIGVRGGQPLLAARHLALLEENIRALLSPAQGEGNCFSALPLPELAADSTGVLRVYVTAGDGGPADAVQASRVFALFEPLAGALPDWQTARLHPEPVTPFARSAKTGNYWMQCAAQSAARSAGFDHALLHDQEGRLLSAAMGNVFFVQNGALCTPSTSLALRPGIMRAWVMAEQSVREVEVAADRLKDAGEIFLTNSRLGVMPLRFGAVEPGPIGCALRDRCRREKIIP